MVQANSNNIQKYLNQDKLTLIDFYATWCGPCMMQSKVLESIDGTRADIDIVKVNIDEEEAIARMYNIESIPTLLLVKKSEVLTKHVGYIDEERLLNMINEYI